jgi:tetratricopeptide (TPR) repeat protein/TolB-like protein
MALDLRDQLQRTLGTTYVLERELGGGGMSRVFVAHETALGRKVVVKVLSPELAAGISVDRFRREIQLAAQLQHAHIVPVLAAGETDGLPFYTMPFVEGESLRARLGGGALPVGEVLSYLRDVARALAYAHARGVVHRDIKPDNVLVAGGSAVVTDFGVAKALSSARGEIPGGTLTSVGTSLGTPAYMAPEQVAADPDTNHRADLYAFGAMAYELLAGRSPFGGRTPQRMLAAHLSERPETIEQLRPDTPPQLAELVMRCLATDPGDRPQTADAVLRELDSSASSGGRSAGPAIVGASRRTLLRALGIYAAAFLAVAIVARAAIIAIGLPDWVFPGSLIVMALGLPAILFTAMVQRQSRLALAAARTTPGGSAPQQSTIARIAVKAQPHVSWRRTALGGATAVGGFMLLVAGYMAMRLLGIGPAGTLSAAGVFGDREHIVVADFASPVADSTLGPVVTEALRTDLAQSPNLSVLDQTRVREVLDRMQVPPTARLDLSRAREVATREGAKAVLDGAVLGLGGSYVVTARLVETASGNELVSFRETADDAKGLLPAIGRLSKALRAKVGESLKSVRAAAPLEEVTTASLPALRKYAEAMELSDKTGDAPRVEALLREAIALDTGFAMAWRKLGIILGNSGGSYATQVDALTHAFNHRDRLGPIERNMAAATYYNQVAGRDDDALAAYEAILDVDSTNYMALNNAAIIYQDKRQPAKAAEYLKRAAGSRRAWNAWGNLAIAQFRLGDTAGAWRTLDTAIARFPANAGPLRTRSMLLFAAGRYDSAEVYAKRETGVARGDPSVAAEALMTSIGVAEVQGRLAQASALGRQWADVQKGRGLPEGPLQAALGDALEDIWFRQDQAGGMARAGRALAANPIDRIPVVQRPYIQLAELYARGGDPARARRVLAEMAAKLPPEAARLPENDPDGVRGLIALAERQPGQAIPLLTAAVAKSGRCELCYLDDLGRAYDEAGNADSALAAYQRYIVLPSPFRRFTDGRALAATLKRAGELYEARGDTARAITAYARFTSLWKNADPELQPRVAEVRQRLESLTRREGLAPRPAAKR